MNFFPGFSLGNALTMYFIFLDNEKQKQEFVQDLTIHLINALEKDSPDVALELSEHCKIIIRDINFLCADGMPSKSYISFVNSRDVLYNTIRQSKKIQDIARIAHGFFDSLKIDRNAIYEHGCSYKGEGDLTEAFFSLLDITENLMKQ